MKKILVIDDYPDNVFLIQDRLEKAGYEVVTAYDGTAGLNKAYDENPDLILLDVMMPDISGFEVCKRLAADKRTKLIPIILLTALIDSDNVKEGLDAGAFDYIKKPFNKAELLSRIKSALRFSEANKVYLEVEKIKLFSATIVTANHEIKQPLTLINICLSAIKREIKKEEISRENIESRLSYIEKATSDIIAILDKLSSIKKPVVTDYVNDLKMIDISGSGADQASNSSTAEKS
jgi:two-component system cell cycle response regulator